jgi:hypothetical protein
MGACISRYRDTQIPVTIIRGPNLVSTRTSWGNLLHVFVWGDLILTALHSGQSGGGSTAWRDFGGGTSDWLTARPTHSDPIGELVLDCCHDPTS